ncbi:MAG: NAD-binding protein [Halobacteriales archaeon]|nr:NAD-binding protein [Halobacteriales archaeon]
MTKRETLAVVLTGLVGVLSVVTGVVSLSYQPYVTPLAQYVPDAVRTAVSLTGAFTGFAMLLSAWGLMRRLRVAWYTSLALLPITALQGVVQSNVLSVPLVVLSIAAIPNLIANMSRFSRRLTLNQGQWAAVGALVSALLYGTVGSYALRDGYQNIQTPIDAFYYTVITISTVGYGDAVPTTQLARTFAVSFVVVGTAAFAFSLATLITPAIEARLSRALGRVTRLQLESLEDHVIVLGYSETTEPILSELKERAPLVVLTGDADIADKLRARDYMVVNANPSDEEALERARLGVSSAVVAATNDDAEDALAVLTARQMNPDVRIVVSCAEEENVRKLRRAGADTVISPATVVGDLLVESALTSGDTRGIVDDVIEEETSDGEAEGDGKPDGGNEI